MTHEEKVRCFIDHVRKEGMNPWSAAPPLFRMLWRLGLKFPPPYFLGFSLASLLYGLNFGVLWGLLMRFGLLRGNELPFWTFLLSAGLAGLLFGIWMGAVSQRAALRLALPRWRHYPDPRSPLAPVPRR